MKATVHIPFSQHVPDHRLVLSMPHDPPRTEPPAADWWERRAAILREVTLPSLARQTHADVDVAGSFDAANWHDSTPVRSTLFDAGARCFFGPPRERFAERYAAHDWVFLAHLDSDDAYAPEALARMLESGPAWGRIVVLMRGHALDTESGVAYEYGHEWKCPPFFGLWAPGDVLADPGAWTAYLAEAGSPASHVRLGSCPGAVLIHDPGMYLVLIHGTNTLTSHAHRGTQVYLGRELDAVETADLVARYGMEGRL